MSELEKIKLTSLNATSYEIEESKKSKGKNVLIEKINVFKEYIQNVYTYKVKNGLERLSDERLSSYIEYLNRENITVNKAIDEIHSLTDNILESSLERDDIIDINKAQGKLDKLTDKKKNIEKELEEAESEKQAREDFEFMQQESESDEMHEVTLEPIEEEIQPVPIYEEVEPVSIPSEDEPVTEVSETIEKPLVITEASVIEPYVGEQTETIEKPLVITEASVIEPYVGEQTEQLEEQPIATIQDEYIEAIDKIENDYKEQFGREFTGIINAIMEETEKYANRQVTEITEVSKKAIDTANGNTQIALEEKAIVENDRDQYKTHYEQTLEVVKQRNETIESKDAEIESLKQELAKRDELIDSKNRDIEELNNTLVEKNNQISNLESDITNYKITIATIMGKNYTQTEVVEEPEVKTR